MNIQKRTKLEHYLSVIISVIVNGGLFAAMLIYITFDNQEDNELQQTMVIDPVDQEIIEEIEEEIVEEVTDMQEMQEFSDFHDIEVDIDFEPEQEVMDAPPDADMTQLTELLSDIASPVVMSGMMPGRTALMRQQARARFGGSDATEAAVQRALRWLQSVQQSNGSWGKEGSGSHSRPNAGHTGLALLTFLSNGQTPSSAEFGETVSRAIRYLVEVQTRDGLITGGGRETYAHPLATYALAEAYTMTGNVLLREPLERAIQVIIRGQMADGGFPGPGGAPNYRYGGGGASDNSLNAWHVQALKACLIAAEVHNMDIPELEPTFQRAMDGMLRLTRRRENGLAWLYTQSQGRDREIVSAAAALGLHLAGRAHTPETQQTLNFISQFGVPEWGVSPNPSEFGGTINLWYYHIQALFHNNPDGRAFQQYNRGMATALVNNQNPEGYWECFSQRGAGQGRVYNTTLAALGLMVYYRYLPTTQADRIQQQPAAQQGGGVEDDDIITITL